MLVEIPVEIYGCIRIIELEHMFLWGMGSIVGSSITTIRLALTTGTEAIVQVALANFMFHVIEIIFWFPIPLQIIFS